MSRNSLTSLIRSVSLISKSYRLVDDRFHGVEYDDPLRGDRVLSDCARDSVS